MKVTFVVVVVAPFTGKIIKNSHNVFERGENLLQKGILPFVEEIYVKTSILILIIYIIFHYNTLFFILFAIKMREGEGDFADINGY